MDAKSVADSLGLELLRVDFVKEYWDNVFSNFLQEYKKGRTPNPDILCNKYIKFSSFLDFAAAALRYAGDRPLCACAARSRLQRFIQGARPE